MASAPRPVPGMNDNAQLLRELRIDRREAPPPARSRLPWILGAIALLLLIAVGWWWGARGGAPEVQVASARAIGAGSGGPASVLDASGYVTARRQATVSSKITGKVVEVLVEEGMRVEEGQVLARLDPLDAQAQRTLSRSQLDAARAQLQEIRTQLALAEKTLVRQRELLARKLVAQSQFDQAQSERDALAARVATAQRNVQVAQDSLALGEIGVDNTVVRAPFAGVVTVKAAQPGEMISPISAGGGFTRSGIATIVDMDSLEVQVDVNESFIGRVQPRQPVEAVLNAYPQWKIPGEVIAIVPTADRGKATVKVRIALKEKDARIVPEMGVRVAFLEARSAQAEAAPAPPPGVLVPAGAIVGRDGKQVVFVLQDDTVRAREVSLGRSLGGDREVSAGLSGGDVVVIDPPESLSDGARVHVATATRD
jgi:RND family efflux transporter MFP subunit